MALKPFRLMQYSLIDGSFLGTRREEQPQKDNLMKSSSACFIFLVLFIITTGRSAY